MLARDIGQALEGFELPILAAGTSQRVLYAQTLTDGSTVIEADPAGPAAAEIRAILGELEGLA